jgi:beta-galactosidase
MYAPAGKLVEMANDPEDGRPIVLCEYCPSMANAVGNLKEYWDAIRGHDRLIGGFIWEWSDQAFRKRVSEGSRAHADWFWAYGGDFGDKPNDGHFCCDGLVQPDRKPNPPLYEVKKVYQRIHVTLSQDAPNRFCVHNEYDFLDLSFVVCSWAIEADGEEIQRGVLPRLSVPAKGSRVISVPFEKPEGLLGAECFIRFSFCLDNDCAWASKGHEVAWEQFPVRTDSSAPALPIKGTPSLSVREADGEIVIRGTALTVRIGKKSGAIESYKYEGDELLAGPLVPNFWRAPIDNDLGNKMPQHMGVWRDAGPKRKIRSVEVVQTIPEAVRVIADAALAGVNARYEVGYTICGNGDIFVDSRLEPHDGNVPELPRIGMQFSLPRDYGTMTWFGRGPHENYWDRKSGAGFGRYSGAVTDLVHSYVRPQENANRCDVRWVAFTNADGAGLIITGIPRMDVSAWPYTLQDLEQAQHIHELPLRDAITVNLDYRQMGLGGDNSWGARPYPQYRLVPRPQRHSFRLTAYHPRMGDMSSVARRTLSCESARDIPAFQSSSDLVPLDSSSET